MLMGAAQGQVSVERTKITTTAQPSPHHHAICVTLSVESEAIDPSAVQGCQVQVNKKCQIASKNAKQAECCWS